MESGSQLLKHKCFPKGPSTKYLRFLVPKHPYHEFVVGPESSCSGYLDTLGLMGHGSASFEYLRRVKCSQVGRVAHSLGADFLKDAGTCPSRLKVPQGPTRDAGALKGPIFGYVGRARAVRDSFIDACGVLRLTPPPAAATDLFEAISDLRLPDSAEKGGLRARWGRPFL